MLIWSTIQACYCLVPAYTLRFHIYNLRRGKDKFQNFQLYNFNCFLYLYTEIFFLKEIYIVKIWSFNGHSTLLKGMLVGRECRLKKFQEFFQRQLLGLEQAGFSTNIQLLLIDILLLYTFLIFIYSIKMKYSNQSFGF